MINHKNKLDPVGSYFSVFIGCCDPTWLVE